MDNKIQHVENNALYYNLCQKMNIFYRNKVIAKLLLVL